MTLATNIATVTDRIHTATANAERTAESVQLLAVSKTRSADELRQAIACGVYHFGENYLQEALEKQTVLADQALEWHFIGPIQSNKTKDIATHFHWVHSVDRSKIARRLNDAATQIINVCLQVNINDEASKAGCTVAEAKDLADFIASQPQLRLRGLMAIPKATRDTAEQRQNFAAVRRLFVELQQYHPNIDTLSMGMSGDLEAAILEGATIVRIGTDIFGARTVK